MKPLFCKLLGETCFSVCHYEFYLRLQNSQVRYQLNDYLKAINSLRAVVLTEKITKCEILKLFKDETQILSILNKLKTSVNNMLQFAFAFACSM